MAEPSQELLVARLSRSHSEETAFEQLTSLAKKHFPDGVFVPTETGVAFVTIHGSGTDQREAMENAINGYTQMKEDGQALPDMLDQVTEMLAERGMSRERHDSIISILEQCATALNDGIITGVINPLMVPSYTRKIEDMRRRVSTRLMMIAQDLSEREKAKARAAQTFPRPDVATPAETEGLTTYQRWKAGIV
jgi:hypothetical protein